MNLSLKAANNFITNAMYIRTINVFLAVFFYCFCIYNASPYFEFSAPTYSIISQKIVKPGEEFVVIVALINVTEETTISCTIRKFDINSSISTQPLAITEYTYLNVNRSVDSCSVYIPQRKTWGNGRYKLEVKGITGYKFEEIIELEYRSKSLVILVQTDKPIYKPGQSVRIRVVVLNNQLMPLDEEDVKFLEIHILDPLDNRLGTFISALNKNDQNINIERYRMNSGVIDGIAYNLHRDSALGTWKIQVTHFEKVQDYDFTVDFYRLPLAKLTLSIPEFLTPLDNKFTVEIKCFYNFGKPLHGMASLSVKVIQICEDFNLDLSKFQFENHPLKGNLQKEFNISNLVTEKCKLLVLNFTAVVIDITTNAKYQDSKLLEVSNNYVFAEHERVEHFRQGNIVDVKSKLIKVPNLPIKEILRNISCKGLASNYYTTTNEGLSDSNNNISYYKNEIICRYYTTPNAYFFTHILLYNNEIVDELFIEPQEVCVIRERIQIFTAEIQHLVNVDDKVSFKVKSTELFNRLHFYTASNGRISNFFEKNFHAYTREINLDIYITREMFPEFIIAVFLVTKNFIISDSTTLKVSGLLKSKVTISMKTSLLNAGEKARFTVKAPRDSRVYLLGIDESVTNFGTGNEIDEYSVTSRLATVPYLFSEFTGISRSGMIYQSNRLNQCESNFTTIECPSRPEMPQKPQPVDITDLIEANVVRNDLRETWIWDNIFMNKNSVKLRATVPDSITKWKITAFAVHKHKGIILYDKPGYVKTFRKFFLKLNLPHKLKSGETSEIRILFFNYLNHSIAVDMDVITSSAKSLTTQSCKLQDRIKQNEIKDLTCFITAKQNGKFNVTAKANARFGDKLYTDGEIKELYVTHEGYEIEVEERVMIDLRDGGSSVARVAHNLSEHIVDDSLKVFVTARAQLLSNAWKVSLVNEVHTYELQANFPYPSGCCEQRFANFFPMVFLLNYLNSTNKLTIKEKNSAIHSMKIYVNLLCFQNPKDGSFVDYFYQNEDYEVLNNNVKNTPSSVWQTANTLKVLYYANKYIYVDPNIITNAINWLKLKSDNYLFYEDNRVMIGTENKEAYLTSFVYLAVQLNVGNDQINWINLLHLEDNFNSFSDTLDITITCYVFQISNRRLKDDCVKVVLSRSELESNGIRTFIGNQNKVAAAYALMIFSHRKSYNYGMETFKYLVSFPQHKGYFEDSHLNGLCYEAMAMFITILQQKENINQEIKVEFNYKSNVKQLVVRSSDVSVGKIEIDNKTSDVSIKASGYGTALASVIWKYNTNNITGRLYTIENTVVKAGTSLVFLNVCNRYNLEGLSYNVITEVDLPSGFTCLNITKGLEVLDKVEYLNDNTHINLYFNKLVNDFVCFKIAAMQTHRVKNIKPGSITTYNAYGDKEMTQKQFYVEPDEEEEGEIDLG